MTLLPESKVAAHISKVLGAAHESGLPVWINVGEDNVRRFILDKVTPEDAMKVDHQIVHDSYTMALRLKKTWGPWHIGQILLKAKEASYILQKQQREIDARNNNMAQSIAASRDINRERKEAKSAYEKFKAGLTPSDVRAIMEKWKKKLGTDNVPDKLVLKWEWDERNA